MRKIILLTAYLFSFWGLTAQTENWNLDFEEWVDSTLVNDSITFTWNAMALIENPYYGGIKNWAQLGTWGSTHRTTDAISGQYAVVVHQWYGGVAGDIQLGSCHPGYMWNKKYCKNAISQRIDKISGYYKFLPDKGGDTSIAKCQIILWKTDTVTGVLDTLFIKEYFFAPVSVYTHFEIPITYPNPLIVPDSFNISFRTHNQLAGGGLGPYVCNGIKNYCNYLYLDGLKVSTISSTKDELDEYHNVNVYPNPCSGFFYLEGFSFTDTSVMYMYNVFGERVKTQTIDNESQKIDVSNLDPGFYFIVVDFGSGFLVHRKILIE